MFLPSRYVQTLFAHWRHPSREWWVLCGGLGLDMGVVAKLLTPGRKVRCKKCLAPPGTFNSLDVPCRVRVGPPTPVCIGTFYVTPHRTTTNYRNCDGVLPPVGATDSPIPGAQLCAAPRGSKFRKLWRSNYLFR